MKRFLMALTVMLLSGWVAAEDGAKPSPLPVEQMRVTAYTKEFAKRFALPDPEPGTEPKGGIQAMEFLVEPGGAEVPFYYCRLKVYLNGGSAIAWPEEGVAGDKRMLRMSSHFFMWPNPDNKRWMSLREEDRLHFNLRQGRYNRSAAIASADYVWRKHGLFNDMFYEEYHRDPLPGLAYAKLDMGCETLHWGERYPALQIWLKREGAPDYRQQLRIDSQDFLKFDLPKPFFEKLMPWVTHAKQYNQKILDEENRLRREMLEKNGVKRIEQ